MNIEEKSVQELKWYKKNNKNHPAKQIEMIANSIKQFWFKNPIIIDKNNEIIAWHGRLLWAKQLGMETVPCIIADDLSEEQVRAYRLLDNRIGDFGEYDIESIIDELKDIGDMQLWLDSLDDLFTDLLPEKENEEAKEDDYEIPDEIKTDIVLWDLFEIGEHRLLCGDSTCSDTVAKLMNGEKADMVFTDPPYNVAYEGGSKKRDAIANDKINDFYKFLYDVYTNCFLFMNDGSPIYVAHSELERANFISAFVDAGFKYSSIIVWVKNNSTFSMNKDYKWKHEPIIYGWKQGKERIWNGDNKQDTVWNIDRPSRSEEHPTMKPIELCKKAIKNSSNESSLIFEPFLGSGSTMVASHQTNRKCYWMELDPKYCQVIIDRMIKLDPTLEIKKNWLSYNPISNG